MKEGETSSLPKLLKPKAQTAFYKRDVIPWDSRIPAILDFTTDFFHQSDAQGQLEVTSHQGVYEGPASSG